MDFLRYKCSKFKLAIESTNLPNVFQGFSSPSTNRTQNKIYSNVTLRHTSEPATCEYSCQGKDMLQMLYKQYKNIPWIMSTVQNTECTFSVSWTCVLRIQLKSEEGNEVPSQLLPLTSEVSCFRNKQLRFHKPIVLCILSLLPRLIPILKSTYT